MSSAENPKEKAPGLLAGKTGRQWIAKAKYVALWLGANLFGGVFWWLEQKRSRQQDQMENEEKQQ